MENEDTGKSEISAAYDRGIQDILTGYLYERDVVYTPEQIEAIKHYKIDDTIFRDIRSENFDNLIEDYLHGGGFAIKIGEGSIEQLVKELIAIEGLFDSQKLKRNLILYRGAGRNIEEGEKKEYNSLVSTAVSYDVASEFAKNNGAKIYKMFLPKETRTIPIELIPIDFFISATTENEIILPPMSFTAGKKQEISDGYMSFDGFVNYEVITAENLEMQSVLQVFKEKMELLPEAINDRLRKTILSTQIGAETEELLNRMRAMGYEKKELVSNGIEEKNQISLMDAIQLLKNNGSYTTFLRKYEAIENDSLQYQSVTHGKEHTKRVLFNAMTLARLENLNQSDTDVLMYAAQYHDIGREHDWEDAEHGLNSSEIIEQQCLLSKDERLTEEDRDLIKFVVAQHSKSKSENELAISQLPIEQQERYKKVLDCLKDADKLDRIRLGKRRIRS